MATSTKESVFVSKFAKTLLGATCLTAATSAVAVAGPYTGPYSSSISTPTVVGQDTPVSGSVTCCLAEYFEYTGLTPGLSLSSILTVQNTGLGGLELFIFNDSDASLSGSYPEIVGPSVFETIFGTVPTDGNVIVELHDVDEGATTWTATLTTSGVPEPATLGAVGIGLVGIGTLARRRRLKK